MLCLQKEDGIKINEIDDRKSFYENLFRLRKTKETNLHGTHDKYIITKLCDKEKTIP